MDDLSGKTAVITGGASGMGLAFANRFADAGMKLVLGDIEEPVLDAAVAELSAKGAEVTSVVTDVSNAVEMVALAEHASSTFGQTNVLCLNAGVSAGSGMHETSLKDWEWCLGVNLWGIINGIHAFLPGLREHGDAHVVITASIAGHTSYGGMGPYNASKHAAVTIAETLYHELSDDGLSVGVTCLCPGLVSTNILDAERNRPEQLLNAALDDASEAEAEERRALVQEVFQNAKPPHEVADLVHDAVIARQFWLFTDNAFDAPIRARHESIQTRTNPDLSVGTSLVTDALDP